MVTDANRKPFRKGIYTDGHDYFGVYKDREDVWFAQTSDHKDLKIAIPQNMPDSSLMPDGQISEFDLEYVPRHRLPEIVKDLERKAQEANDNRELINTFLKCWPSIRGAR